MDFNVKQAIIDRLTATKRVNRIALYNYMLKNGFYCVTKIENQHF